MKSFKGMMLAGLLGIGLITPIKTQCSINYFNALRHTAIAIAVASAVFLSSDSLKTYNAQKKELAKSSLPCDSKKDLKFSQKAHLAVIGLSVLSIASFALDYYHGALLRAPIFSK